MKIISHLSAFISIIFNFLFFIFYFSPPAHAQIISDLNEAFKAVGGNPFKYQNIGCLVSSGLNLALTLVGILVLLYILWGGIQWIISGGDKNTLESAKSKITNALLGLAIIAGLWAIFLVIRAFLGLPVAIGPGGTGGSCNVSNPI
jgi:hypothetical protein